MGRHLTPKVMRARGAGEQRDVPRWLGAAGEARPISRQDHAVRRAPVPSNGFPRARELPWAPIDDKMRRVTQREPAPPPDTQSQSPTIEDRLGRLERRVQELQIRYWGLLESALWLVLGIPLLYIAVRFDRPGGGLLWPRLYDVVHVVLSTVLALVLLRVSRRVLFGVFRSPFVHYALVTVVAVGVGAGIELLQLALRHGDASYADVARDALGSAAGLCLALSRESHRGWAFQRSRRLRWSLRAAAIGALVLALLPTMRTLNVLRAQRQAFPTLCDFEASWEGRFVAVNGGAELAIQSGPALFTSAHGRNVGKVTFAPNTLSGLELNDVPEDWSAYSQLEFEVYSPEELVTPLELRVHDQAHRHQYSDRFNTTLQVKPGQTTVSIPLAEVRRGPTSRQMDMSHIKGIIVFMVNPSSPRTLFFDNFRLSGSPPR